MTLKNFVRSKDLSIAEKKVCIVMLYMKPWAIMQIL